MAKLDIKVVENKPGQKAQGAVIWLHGLGADYNDFVPIVAELNLTVAVKFVFPNAPIIPVTINNGMQMRAWYDIINFSDLHREVDSRGIQANVAHIQQLIEELLSEGFTAEQIVIAGFSQGGVISYYAALDSDYSLAGLLVLSSYLPDSTLLDVAKIQQKRQLPILICHGRHDPVVSIEYARQASQYLQAFDLNLEWHEYSMEHSVCWEEIQTIASWLQQRFEN